MNRIMCRWNDSSETEPCAQQYVFSFTPPLLRVPVWTNSWMLAGSWMQLMCFFSSDQILSMSGWSKIVIPSVSWPLSPLRLLISWSINSVVVSAPHVRRQQWSASSLLLSSRRAADSSQFSSTALAWHSLAVSSASHSNMHVNTRDTPYSWCILWRNAIPDVQAHLKVIPSVEDLTSCGPQQSRST